MYLTYNIHIKDTEDAICYLELEEEHLYFNKIGTKVHIASSNSQGEKGNKCKYQSGKQQEMEKSRSIKK